MATRTTDLASMTAAQRLAFYRQANKAAKPAAAADFSITEAAAKVASDISVVPTNFMAAFRYHRKQALGE